jgi:nucleosome binding factor SPN SPT16 subunit
MKNFFVEEFQAIIDEGKKITHEALSIQTEECIIDEKMKAKMRFPKDVKHFNICLHFVFF